MKYATPTKNVPIEDLCKHISSIKQKRDRKTLEHRRTLATVFKGSSDAVGLSKRFVEEAAKETSLYASKQSKVQKVIGDFLLLAAVDDPCKSSQSCRQLTKPVKQLFKEFKAKHKSVCADISQA